MTATIIVSVFLIPAIIMLIWWRVSVQKHNDFIMYLKAGDRVDYFIGENRETYTLVQYSEDVCKIKRCDKILYVDTSKLYPNLYYTYKR